MSARRASINDIQIPPNAVKGLELDTLKVISEQDEGSFYEFLEGLKLEDLKKVRSERTELQEKIRELAVQNCEMEPRFNSAKSELRQKSTESADLKEEYEKKFEELRKFVSQHDPSKMLKDMTKAVKDAENDSEDFASQFLKNKEEISVEDFSEKFVELRKLYWLRKVKAEKMNELVKNNRPKAMPRSSKGGGHSPTTQNPVHSLPSGRHAPPYPSSESAQRPPPPGASLPPYGGPAQTSMPQPHPAPGHPFPAAAFPSSYRHQQPGVYVGRPPPRPQPPHTRQPYNSYR